MPTLYLLPPLANQPLSSSYQADARKAPKLTFIDNARDVQLYLKPKYNLVRTWDQEFGIQATLARYGNLSEVTNFCYDPLYPINLDKKPRFSVGFQIAYTFTGLPSKISVYTKTKELMTGPWKQESGFSMRLYTSKSLIVSTSLAYVYNYPYRSHQKPQYLSLVNLQFPLGR